jgi:hypothetical protein
LGSYWYYLRWFDKLFILAFSNTKAGESTKSLRSAKKIEEICDFFNNLDEKLKSYVAFVLMELW